MRKTLLTPLLALAAAGCAHLDPRAASPVPLAQSVDLERFAGNWYVIAHITSDGDRDAHNAVETYTPVGDGRIDVVYTNRQGGFDGETKRLEPTGFVVEGSNNALWGMRFNLPLIGLPWPFHFEYRISHLEPDYSVTIIGRSKRDLVWLMARKPDMNEADFQRYRQMIAGWGYDVGELVRVPQRWPDSK